MLKTCPPDDARRLRDFLAEADYTPLKILEVLKTDTLPSQQLRNLPRLLYMTSEPKLLHTLLRWFVVGVPVKKTLARELVPETILELFLRCRLLQEDADSLKSEVLLSPFENFWIATDTYARIKGGAHDDSVLMINPTTCIGLQFAVRRHSRATLDLGTGCGLLALWAAGHSDHVVATDITSRAIEFARFNAWLNGIANIDCLQGDLFEPVAGRQFDLIVANPPFYITPSSKILFAENPMDLDGFCRRLVKEAPPHLNEGGFLQLLCDWVEIEGQPWQERLVEWFRGTGCDALVLHGGAFDPAEYAEQRIQGVTPTGTTESDAEVFAEWMNYYRSRNLASMHIGMIAIRKRSGRNWVHFERLEAPFAGEVGEAIQARFRNHDFVLAAGDQDLLAKRFQIADGVQWRQSVEWKDGDPDQPGQVKLVQSGGLHCSQELTQAGIALVTRFDTRLTLAEVIGDITESEAPDEIRNECLSLVRWLIDRGFVTWS